MPRLLIADPGIRGYNGAPVNHASPEAPCRGKQLMKSRADDGPLNTSQMTINTAGLLLLFGFACFTLATWLVQHFLPARIRVGSTLLGACYLLGVGALLVHMATQGLKFGRYLTHRIAIQRDVSPIPFWLLTVSMGGVGTALMGAGAFALARAFFFT
jgi:hypothetical protein